MFLIFGGTTEGKETARVMEELALPYWYSTFSDTGFIPGAYGQIRSGPLSKEELIHFCKNKAVHTLIDAAHPFAAELHQTISAVSLALALPVIRWQRSQPARSNMHNIVYRSTLKELAAILLKREKYHWLSLMGVKQIPLILQLNPEGKNYFRILPRQQSVQEALHAGLLRHQIIEGYPGTAEEEKRLWQQSAIHAVLTKENGFTGRLPEKIKAATQTGITLGILTEPQIPAHFTLIHTKEELIHLLHQ